MKFTTILAFLLIAGCREESGLACSKAFLNLGGNNIEWTTEIAEKSKKEKAFIIESFGTRDEAYEALLSNKLQINESDFFNNYAPYYLQLAIIHRDYEQIEFYLKKQTPIFNSWVYSMPLYTEFAFIKDKKALKILTNYYSEGDYEEIRKVAWIVEHCQ